jgi:hypothetical protein
MKHCRRCISEQAEKDKAVEAATAQEAREQDETILVMDRGDREAFEQKKRDRMTMYEVRRIQEVRELRRWIEEDESNDLYLEYLDPAINNDFDAERAYHDEMEMKGCYKWDIIGWESLRFGERERQEDLNKQANLGANTKT